MGAADRAKLEEILRVVLELPPESAVEGLTRARAPKWDSLAQATLVAALEDEFGIAFEIAELAQLESFSGIVSTVGRKLG